MGAGGGVMKAGDAREAEYRHKLAGEDHDQGQRRDARQRQRQPAEPGRAGEQILDQGGDGERGGKRDKAAGGGKQDAAPVEDTGQAPGAACAFRPAGAGSGDVAGQGRRPGLARQVRLRRR